MRHSRLFRDVVKALVDHDHGTIRVEGATKPAKPLHLHQNASFKTYTYGDSGQSSIYRTDYRTYLTMAETEPEVLQTIFHERSILVRGCDATEAKTLCDVHLDEIRRSESWIPIGIQGCSQNFSWSKAVSLMNLGIDLGALDHGQIPGPIAVMRGTLEDILAYFPMAEAVDHPLSTPLAGQTALNSSIPINLSVLDGTLEWR